MMCPTVLKYKNYRFFFFSREVDRIHVHVSSPDGEVKFWIEPLVALADFKGLSARQLRDLEKVVRNHAKEIKQAWKSHYGSC